MSFRFNLETVLRLRRSLEERERLRLMELFAQREALRRELQELQNARSRGQEQMQESMLGQGVRAAEIHFLTALLQANEFCRKSLQSRIEDLQTTIQKQVDLYRSERQKREILESLREEQIRKFRFEQQRREQSQLDELHLLRRIRERRFLPSAMGKPCPGRPAATGGPLPSEDRQSS